MADWTYEALCDALARARRIYGTRRYRDLVANCREAVRCELNWTAQFGRLKRYLPESLQ
jgi:hypothetical protein